MEKSRGAFVEHDGAFMEQIDLFGANNIKKA